MKGRGRWDWRHRWTFRFLNPRSTIWTVVCDACGKQLGEPRQARAALTPEAKDD
jgi:hypothetical protein